MIKQFKGIRLLHDLAGVHNVHIITDLRYHAKIMGDDQHAHIHLLAQLFHQPEDLRFDRHIQSRCRLVSNQKLWLAQHGHGDHDSLPQSSGQLVGIAVIALLRFRNADPLKHVNDLARGFVLIHGTIMHKQRLADLPSDLENRI